MGIPPCRCCKEQKTSIDDDTFSGETCNGYAYYVDTVGDRPSMKGIYNNSLLGSIDCVNSEIEDYSVIDTLD